MSYERTPKHIRIFEAYIKNPSNPVTPNSVKEMNLTESDYKESYNFWRECSDKKTDYQICKMISDEMNLFDTYHFPDEPEEDDLLVSAIIVIDDKAYYCDENTTFTPINWGYTASIAETLMKNEYIRELNKEINICDVMIRRFKNYLVDVIDNGSEDWEFDETHWGERIANTALLRNRYIRIRNLYIETLKNVTKKLTN